MSNIRISIETGNAAFEDNPDEIEHVLEKVARGLNVSSFTTQEGYFTVQDSNGNTVCSVEVLEADKEFGEVSMGSVVIEFNTDNAAFEDYDELNIVLAEVVRKINAGEEVIRDSNGNTIGSISTAPSLALNR